MDAKTRAAFRSWFNTKWAEWDAREGRRTTQQELADYLKITRSGVAQYVSGRQVPDGETLRKIAAKFGNEVYGILGIEQPAVDPIDLLPPEFRERLGKVAYQLDKYLKDNSIPENSPEALAIANEMLAEEFRQAETEQPD